MLLGLEPRFFDFHVTAIFPKMQDSRYWNSRNSDVFPPRRTVFLQQMIQNSINK